MTTSPASPPASVPARENVSMRMRELVFGAACAAAVRTAAALRVADALGETPATADELATAVGVQSDPLARLLRALSSYGVFAEDESGRFAHTEMSRLLQEDSPDSLRYIALWCTEPWTWQAWPHLPDAVRSGRSVFPEVFGKEFFEYLHDGAGESARVFDKAMTQSSRQSAADVAGFVDLAGATSVVDIGGGQGHVLAALLEKYPQLHGTLLDLPAVVANADPRLREGGALCARAEIIAGDCRTAIPVEADLYIIKNVLEWDDESTRRTLRNIVEAARPGARVLAIENLVDESRSMRFTTAMDLMLLLNVGGAKHTKASLTALMDEAGLQIKDVRPVNPYLHAFDSTV
ncbi:methyltransferase [Actinospica durhamensis]|uniref:Methyltransferase n=1 Tax=Actinospica durhamensis TaxID=1508375 RepID=A0A941EUM9_9ACTN|nr:methyltransferase [Actinospica durhamensis]MBR7837601.1 methyltransferase [Actinospica durhamensis]